MDRSAQRSWRRERSNRSNAPMMTRLRSASLSRRTRKQNSLKDRKPPFSRSATMAARPFFAQGLHIAETETYAIFFRRTRPEAFVHVHGKTLYPVTPRIADDHLGDIETHGLVIEEGAVELRGVIELEKGRPVAEQGEAHGMALAETEFGETAYEVEDLLARALSTPFPAAPL